MSARFGTMSDGTPVDRLVLGREPGPVLHLLTLGAAVHRLEVTGGDGVRRNVALGHATVGDHLDSADYLGAVVGRYANRIRDGHVEIDGVTHRLAVNDRGHHLHGGPDGFHRRVWQVADRAEDRARLVLRSPAGDQGYPGALEVSATYAVGEAGVRLDLVATTDAPTLVNLTSHVYLHLGGGSSIDDHRLTVPADAYLPVDDTGIPTGEICAVDGTRFDLRVGPRLGDLGDLDHNLVVSGTGDRTVATLADPSTRTTVRLSSDRPGLQVYTGQLLPDPRSGIALEPQAFPDSPHHVGEPGWPSALLRPGGTYHHTLEWQFARPPVS